MTAKEKLVLSGFERAKGFAGGPVTPGDVYHALALLDDPNLSSVANGPRDMEEHAESLHKKGYLKEAGRGQYLPV